MSDGTGRGPWRRSVHCSGGACLEIWQTNGEVLVRNSALPDQNLRLGAAAWMAFVATLKAGAFAGSGDFAGRSVVERRE